MKLVSRYSIFFLLLFYSCTYNNKDKVGNTIKNSSTKLVREIPTYKNGTFDLFYLITENRGKTLHLDDLSTGYDSIQIRIWHEPTLSPDKELIILKNKNGAWSGEYFSMTVKERFNDLDTVTSYKKTILSPKSGWDNFITSIFDLKLVTLPNMFDIPGLVDNSTDGTIHNIEIATKKKYRFYSYSSLYVLKDKYWQVNNVHLIISILKNEFKLTW